MYKKIAESLQTAEDPWRVTHAGFTLLELLITVAIASILIGIAAPGFTSFIESNRVSMTRDSLAKAIHFARSEAVYKKTTVTICSSQNQTNCSNSGNWSDGWIVFEDLDASGDWSAGERLLEVNEGNSKVAITGVQNLTFALSGLRSDGNGPQTFSVCPVNSSVAGKGVSVTVTGATSYESGAGTACSP